MNKADIILITSIALIVLLTTFYITSFQKEVNQAVVYYENKEILKIKLDKEKTYKVKGYNGNVIIKTQPGKIKVDEELSPKNICSRQGYISKSYETITCLPNKIIIKLIGDELVDTVVK